MPKDKKSKKQKSELSIKIRPEVFEREILKNRLNRASEKIKPKPEKAESKLEKEAEEQEAEDEREEPIELRQIDFSRPIIPLRPPVLAADSSEEPVESLEQFANQTLAKANAEKTDGKAGYVQNLPDYAGSDYSSQAVYTAMEQAGRELKTDREMNITRAPMMHRVPTQEQMQEESREINLRAWQREQLARPAMAGRVDMSEQERDYQIIGKKEKREKNKLPFQE